MSLDRIDKTVQFSRDILDLVKSRVLREKQQVNLTGLIERVIENRFAAKLQSFVWESPKIPMTIHGDWGKLEQLFHNLFKNSFEAGAQNIRIRHRVGNGVLALTLEDDGLGVDAPEKLAKFFKAFFTTKDGKFGSGLGLSICRAIIESHGGAVSAYSRNLSDGDGHGVRFMLTFPLYDTQEQKAGTPTGVVVLVKDGIDDIEGVLRVLRNVHVTPRVCAQVGEVGAAAGDRHLRMVLMAANRTGRIIEGGGGQWGSVVLLATDKQTIYAMNTIPSGRPQLFTEEYVISTIVA